MIGRPPCATDFKQFCYRTKLNKWRETIDGNWLTEVHMKMAVETETVIVLFSTPIVTLFSYDSVLRLPEFPYTQGEVTSQSVWSRYDRHFVGITRHNALS